MLYLAACRVGTFPALPDVMAKPKLKWFREGCDPHEDLFLIPVDQARNVEDDLNVDAAVAWIKIAYDRTRFYHGRGGEGTSRPDSYVAYVQDEHPRRRHLGCVITEGADAVAHVGGLFSGKSDKAFRSLRAAKQAIAAELEKRAAAKQAIVRHCEACTKPIGDGDDNCGACVNCRLPLCVHDDRYDVHGDGNVCPRACNATGPQGDVCDDTIAHSTPHRWQAQLAGGAS